MPQTSLASKKQLSDAHLPQTGPALPLTPRSTGPSEPATILLVDDDSAVLKSLGRVLASEGWQVVSAASGEEALETLTNLKPDLMITDLRMAGVSGWDLLFHENIQRPSLPIFVMTALPPSAVAGANLIAAEFFQKPLDPGELVAAIRRRLGSVRSEQPQASI